MSKKSNGGKGTLHPVDQKVEDIAVADLESVSGGAVSFQPQPTIVVLEPTGGIRTIAGSASPTATALPGSVKKIAF